METENKIMPHEQLESILSQIIDNSDCHCVLAITPKGVACATQKDVTLDPIISGIEKIKFMLMYEEAKNGNITNINLSNDIGELND